MAKLANIVILLVIGEIWVTSEEEPGFQDTCSVMIMELTSKAIEDDNSQTFNELGRFLPIVGEEDLTERAFKIPDSKQYLIARVFYTDESMALHKEGTNNDCSVLLSLTVSSTPSWSLSNCKHLSCAEIMYERPTKARVSLIFKIGKKMFMAILVYSCERKEE